MAEMYWSQDVFSKGELAPLMYARITVNSYYNSLKTAKNVLTYPQGAAGKRFGLLHRAENTSISNTEALVFATFEYLDQGTYLLVFTPEKLEIYFEGKLIKTLSTSFKYTDIVNMDYTVIENRFRITTGRLRPKDLVRSQNTTATISSINTSTNIVTHSGSFANDTVLPIELTTTGTLPSATPNLTEDVVYFVHNLSGSTFKLYTNSVDAFNQENEINFSGSGSGTHTIGLQNGWTLSNAGFENFPVFDFDEDYDNINFTPSATTGTITITASSAIFSSGDVGGIFSGNGGIARITGFSSSTVVNAVVTSNFNSTSAISGRVSVLAEPAFSDTRGWPRKCSTYQNRAFYANTRSIPNGIWGSMINDYNNFNDTETLDDNAISWFPQSDEVNYIRFLVPYRTLTVHTNSGVFSTPLGSETAITPTNFSLTLQEATPSNRIQPTTLDNQILIVSGNDVHSMLWDGLNNAYSTNIISVTNEHLIRNPKDQASYAAIEKPGSRYMFIVNEDGSLAVFQSLISEDVSGFTPFQVEQHYGKAWFRRAESDFNGRAWFIIEREVAEADSKVTIDSVSDSNIEATGSNFSTTNVTAAKFSTSGTLPDSSPKVTAGNYYWVLGVDNDNFVAYTTIEDAENEVNPITWSAGTGSGTHEVEPWPLTSKFFIEELSFNDFVDSGRVYDGSDTSSISGLSRLNAQKIVANGDGYEFEDIVNNNTFEFKAHGDSVDVSTASLGHPINYEVALLPLSFSMGNSVKTSNLPRPKHVRNAVFMFNNTIGGQINGVDIALTKFNAVKPDEPPEAQTGVVEQSVMKGWDDFNKTTFTITHSNPYDIRFLGIFYKVEI